MRRLWLWIRAALRRPQAVPQECRYTHPLENSASWKELSRQD